MKSDYLKLMEERPELFKNTDVPGSIHIYTQPNEITKIEKEQHTEIGILYQDNYIILLKDAVRYPNETDGTYIRIIYAAKKGGVVILPLWKDKDMREHRILLLSHYRHATRRTYLEMPRGFAEESLSETENVYKELFEETGCQISRLVPMGNLVSDTGLIGETVKIYAAYLTGIPYTVDTIEGICNIQILSTETVKSMIRKGLIMDGYTLAAMALAQAKGII